MYENLRPRPGRTSTEPFDDLSVSREQEVSNVSFGGPHVFLLGAGASRAAFPMGDVNGQRLPLMADFEDIVPIRGLLELAGLDGRKQNFETTYSALASDSSKTELRRRLEEVVETYFDSLELPPQPTLYDYLIFCLRGKDVIATFNWDPFLMQAARRSGLKPNQIPRMVFLHGNVATGYCSICNTLGPARGICGHCGMPFEASPLLFPVGDKDYVSSPSIQHAWAGLELAMKRTFWLTIFGYSAPVSDSGAIARFKSVWGPSSRRILSQVEVIDLRAEADLLGSWKPFIHSHHYRFHNDFFSSWAPRHPRRSGEAYEAQYLNAQLIEDNRVPMFNTMEEMRAWFGPLLSVEEASQNQLI